MVTLVTSIIICCRTKTRFPLIRKQSNLALLKGVLVRFSGSYSL